MTDPFTDEFLNRHVDSLIEGAKKAKAEPALMEFVDSVYRPFVKTLAKNMRQRWGIDAPVNDLFDAVVDMLTLMIVHASNYSAPHEELDKRLAFINVFFLNAASRMNDMLTEMYPGADFENIALREMDEALAQKPH